MLLITDDYGRLAELTAAPAGVWGFATSGPIIPPMPAVARSPKWPGFLKHFLEAHPACEGCGRKAETGHHCLPFGVDPAREIDPTNIVAVCVPCHWVVAHAGDWHTYDPDPRAALAAHLSRVRKAVRI